MKTATCTPLTCPVLGRLDDQYQQAKTARNWAEASRLWALIRAHEKGPECAK